MDKYIPGYMASAEQRAYNGGLRAIPSVESWGS